MTWLTNPSRFEVAGCAPECASIYESHQALCVVQKQRYVCWFSGASLDGRWTIRNVSSAGTFGMSDGIDQGFRITTGSPNGARSRIDFNNIRHYDCNAAVSIQVVRSQFSNRVQIVSGFVGAVVEFPLDLAYTVNDQLACSTFNFSTGDGCCVTTSNSCVTTDGAWRVHKIELTACCAQFTLCGGCVDSTNSCNLPAIPQQAIFDVRTVILGGHWGEIRYSEAYNT